MNWKLQDMKFEIGRETMAFKGNPRLITYCGGKGKKGIQLHILL